MLLQAAEIKEFLSTFLDGASMFLSLFLDLFLLTWSLWVSKCCFRFEFEQKNFSQ